MSEELQQQQKEPFIRDLISVHFRSGKYVGPNGEHYASYKKKEWLLSHGFTCEEATHIIADARKRIYSPQSTVISSPKELLDLPATSQQKVEVAMLLAGMSISPNSTFGTCRNHIDMFFIDETLWLHVTDERFDIIYDGPADECVTAYLGDEDVKTLTKWFEELNDKKTDVPDNLITAVAKIVDHSQPFAQIIEGKNFKAVCDRHHRVVAVA